MSISAFRGMKPFSQLIFSGFVIVVTFLIVMFLGMLVSIPLFGFDSFLAFQSGLNIQDVESLKLLKFLQVVQSIGLFILPPFIIAWLFHERINQYLLLNKNFTSASAVYIILLILFTLPLINFLGEWNSQMQFPEWASGLERWMKNAEERAEEITEAFLKTENIGGLMFNLFMIAVLPALGEELLFRGVIQRIFTQWTRNYHWGIWISSILFSALHMQFYGFVPRLLLGVLFGYLLVWSGTIWLPILAHFLNNAFAVVAMYLVDNKIINPEIEEIGSTTDGYFAVLLSVLVVSALMWMIRRDNFGREPVYVKQENG
ncbi:MAG TPA: CPBP family intramembrane glutamic endopeptidase [Mariniphaga sp.]|nr:CPBP family intramembrane glutamic endopeptidase [Mariniphaga sp.]